MRNSSRALYEARIEELKAAHEVAMKERLRVIEALAEQVEYLRAQLAMNQRAPITLKPQNPSEQPPLELHSPSYLSEEEEDMRELHQMGLIDDNELAAALRRLGPE